MGELSRPEDHKVTVAALIRKRRDIAFEATELEQQVEAKRTELIHIDSVIRMFAPDLRPDTLPERQRRPRRLDYFAHGELGRRVLDALRVGGTILAIDIVRQAMADKELSFDGDRRTRIEFARRITQRLNDMARKGQIEKVGAGRGVRWKIAPREPELGV